MILGRSFELGFFVIICIYAELTAATPSPRVSDDVRVFNNSVPTTPKPDERPICVYSISKKVNTGPNDTRDRILENGLVQCNETGDYCFSYWEGTEDGEQMIFLARGCFHNAITCERKECVSRDHRKNGSYFCCCKGSMCNQNVSINITETTPAPVDVATNTPEPEMNTLSQVLYILLGFGLFCSFIIAGFLFMRRRKGAKIKEENRELGLQKSPTSPCIDLNNIQFLEMIGQGRYGSVYRAHLSGEEVAVKLFEQQHKSSFTNENYIYSLPLMEHENLLSYLGGGELFGPSGNPCLGIVLSYCSGGKLSSYLQRNTLDWADYIKMSTSIVKGVTHLHSAIKKGDLFKPCVSHRDLKTSNILIRSDKSCVVSDLGFAIHTKNTVSSLTDVGTYRYMAPEVLEGAVNLRECEYSLKQIDIYALGLVLWEVATRCQDFYQGMPTPVYKPPFQDEVGTYPAFERMQFYVVQKRKRPEFPSVWKITNPFFRALRNTMEECWDNDADARLTADCVENRLLDLQELWSRQKGSNSLNSSFNGGPPPEGFTNIINELRDGNEKREESNGSDSLKIDKNTVADNVPFLQPIEPHQGLNPCQERNLVSNTAENELKIEGNMLRESSDCIDYQHSAINGLSNATLIELIETHPDIGPKLAREQLIPLLTDGSKGTHPSIPNISADESFLAKPLLPKIPHLQNVVKVDGLAKKSNVSQDSNKKWSNESRNSEESSPNDKKWPFINKKIHLPNMKFFS